MNAQPPPRGRHVVKAGRGFATAGLVSRLFARGFGPVIDRIDAGLAHGSILATLPDGSRRMLGGRGAGPVAEIHLHDWRSLLRLASSGSVGWYRAWELGEWSSPDPVPIFDLFTRNRATLGNAGRAKGLSRLVNSVQHALRGNSRRGSRRNIEFHYDLGNDFYAAWLDPTMSYSSALFSAADSDETLEQAQHRKIAAIADRLAAQPGDHVLEIGCGWGSLAHHLAAERQLRVTGLTLSEQQAEWALRANTGLPVEIRIADYRDETGVYDAIASVEMVEAVGQQYWPDFLDALHRCLKPGGRAALQYIRIADDIFQAYSQSADFIQTYIFPGGLLLSESRFRALAEERGFAWTDQQDMGDSYARTLKLWRENLDMAVEQGRMPPGFDERFLRLWRYYLMYCEGGFRGGGINVAQVTLIK
ncbi:MAG: cyclopropane-fatty-acyl-phospholipid synthase family protein [Blastomonas sp.]